MRFRPLLLPALLLVGARLVAGEPARPTSAREILDRARQLNQTTRKWTDRTEHLKLRIVDRRGGTRERAMQYFHKKYDQDRSKAIVFFLSPPDVKGTGFLQWIDPHTANQQWLFLPELKRTRQISGTGKRESFMGTDFSYEDLGIMSEILDWSDADAASSLEREEPCGDGVCWVLMFVPKEKDVGYGRIRLWLDAEFRQRRLQFCDAAGQLLKTLETSDFRQVGTIPTAFHWEMRDEHSGGRTEVEFEDMRYDSGLDDSLFTQARLEKGA